MKKSLLLLLTVLMVAACNNIEKSKDQIVAASDKRDVLMENLRELNRNIGGELERWSFYQGELVNNPGNPTNLTPEQQTELNKLLEQFTNYSAAFSAFIQEVNGLAKEFPTQQVELDSMRKAANGLGTYEGNFKKKVADVEAANAAIEAKIKGWEERATKLGQEIEANYKKIRALQGMPIE
ncbi:MAG: hypothetical protein ACK4TA_25370 [Saprospiraceae bacterium]